MRNLEICDKYMEEYIELERNQRLPFKMTWHLLTCKDCRSKVRMLSQADKTCKQSTSKQTDIYNATIENILKQLNLPLEQTDIKPFSMAPWIIGGWAIIGAIIFFVLGRWNESTSLGIYAYITMAFILILYIGFFILSHLDFFVKKFDTIETEPEDDENDNSDSLDSTENKNDADSQNE